MGNQKPIRRCSNCNYKTHKRLWVNNECPICETNRGWIESAHGGLGEKQIAIARDGLKMNIQKIEGRLSPRIEIR